MATNTEALDTQIPYYLTESQKLGLRKAFKDFQNAEPITYFINNYADIALQGDGWPGLQLFRFDTGEKLEIKGIILSNSCDISAENTRDFPSNIVFAPLVSLAKFRTKLEESGLSNQQIDAKIRSIREQLVTNIFYLPAEGNLEVEYMALLDDLHTMPLRAFMDSPDRRKLFTLSMIGFYLFVFKLSIHFCRFHEEITR